MKKIIVIVMMVFVAGIVFGEDYSIDTIDETDDFTGISLQGVKINLYNTDFSTLKVIFRIWDGEFNIFVIMSGDGWDIKHLYIKADDLHPIDCYLRGWKTIPDGYKVMTAVFADLTSTGMWLIGDERDPVNYIMNAATLHLRLVYDSKFMPGEDEILDITLPDEYLQKVKDLDWGAIED